MNVELHCGDALEILKTLPDQSVNCCVTSPPYYGLRDYGVDGQIGLEATPEEYIEKIVDVFREVRHVLCDDGTAWINLGDSYAGSGKGGQSEEKLSVHWNPIYPHINRSKRYSSNYRWNRWGGGNIPTSGLLKPKDLIGIPWRIAFALQADGCVDQKVVCTLERIRTEILEMYEDEIPPDKVLNVLERLELEYMQAKGSSWWLRSDIIWSKPNPMPESVTDRPTRAHEYIFLLSKSAQYYYDAEAIREPIKTSTIKRLSQPNFDKQNGGSKDPKNGNRSERRTLENLKERYSKQGVWKDRFDGYEYWQRLGIGRNRRSMWEIATQPYKEAHFATFPPKLVEPCILAGCPAGGTVLDPFSGAGTSGVICVKHSRNYIGIEINPDYVEMSRKRIDKARQQMRMEI